jgi:type IV secretory pathway VirB6-like protein
MRSFSFTPNQILWSMFLLFGGLALMMLLNDPAFAQVTALPPSGGGKLAAPMSKGFSCASGRATGDLIAKASSCPTELKWDNIFSFLVCQVEVMTSQIFGNVYCGILKELQPAVKAVLTLGVVFFGVGFTIGVIPATGREFITFLLKIAFIWAFATQAEYMIGYGFNFLLAGLRDGTTIAMSSVLPPNPKTGAAASSAADMYAFLDAGMLKLVGFATETAGKEWGVDDNPCQNAIFAALAIMAIAFPPLFLLSVLLLAKMVMVFLRSCFGYMFSLVGIAFLMILSPIFLSFSLFKQTRYLFDKWLGYLCSFTLQMVIIFTFIAFIISMNPSALLGSLTKVVVPVQEAQQNASYRWPWEYCTICLFEVVDGGTVGSDGEVVGGRVRATNENINPATDLLRCVPGEDEAFTVLNTAMPDAIDGHRNVLMNFAGTAILSLLILAYLVDQMLYYVPSIAWRLASSLTSGVYAPQVVGGGHAQTTTVTAGPIELLETAGNGFYQSYTNQLRDREGNNVMNVNAIDVTGRALNDAGSRLMVGTESDPGLVDSFMRFFINPTRTNSNEF